MDLCELEVNPGIQCLEPAPNSIRIRDAVTRMTTVVKVCDKHAREHRQQAGSKRIKQKQK